jgi:Tfp pilus assembly major pilin PilA
MVLLNKKQKGVTLTGLLVICVILGVAGILAAKVLPVVIEYYAIVKNVKAVANDSNMKGASIPEIKLGYAKRAEIDNISDIKRDDLDISKDGDQLVIGFAYAKKIPLFANASLVLDFEHSTDQAQ